MISKRLEQEINDQITAELWSAQIYLQMSFFLKKEGWNGFAKWMAEHSDEEKEHACKLGDFLVERGGEVRLDKIDVVPCGWGNVLEVFSHAYEHECHVSSLIDKLVDVAIAEKDKAAEDFLMGFVREQVEEEAVTSAMVESVKHAGTDALFFLDRELLAK